MAKAVEAVESQADEGPATGGQAPQHRGGRAAPVRLSRRLSEYAETYKITTREIKRWIWKGRACDPEDLPPLDDPVKMLEWWPRHNRRRAPQRLLDAAEAARADPVALAPESRPPPDQEAPTDDLSFVANLDRMRQAAADAHREYKTALALGEEGKAQAAMRRWSDLSEQRRKMEKDRADVEKALGDSLPRATVAGVLVQVHGTIASGLRSLVRRIRDEMALWPPDKWDGICRRELARQFAGWPETGLGGGPGGAR